MTAWPPPYAATTADLLAWAAEQPWARAMAACQQDAGWHAEGDVWTHTRMVVAELERLPDWPTLDQEGRLALLFTALFHDAGKPATTIIDPVTGRTRSPKHALAGEKIARSVLRELGCPLVVREAIAGLVRYHGRPPYVLEPSDPAREVIRLSWLLNHQRLTLFARADTRGRLTHDEGRPEEALDLWQLLAEEHGCWDRSYPFANDHARFLFGRGQLANLHYIPREAYRCTVTMMSGLPGAGKDTWLEQQRPELPVVSLDRVRELLDVEATDNQGLVIQRAREECREHLRAGRDFAFNATNTIRVTRTQWIDLFADYGARIELVYLEPPLPTIRARNQRRAKSVPRAVMEHLAAKLEPPTWLEAHAVMLVE